MSTQVARVLDRRVGISLPNNEHDFAYLDLVFSLWQDPQELELVRAKEVYALHRPALFVPPRTLLDSAASRAAPVCTRFGFDAAPRCRGRVNV